jgi:DNA-directed RNA polymerase sigma subunit (sigma70/sigma32)
MEIVEKIIRGRENQVMYLRMEGRTFQAIGDIVGLSKERIRQITRRYQRRCQYEATRATPTEYEIVYLVPHLDSIKAIYESE